MSCGPLELKATGHALERQSRICLKIAPQEFRETEAAVNGGAEREEYGATQKRIGVYLEAQMNTAMRM